MLRRIGYIVLHLVVILLLTALTQVGGLVYVLVILFIRSNVNRYRLKRLALFMTVYLLATLLIVPFVAPFFGREKIKNTEVVRPHSLFYTLANRNYVTPQLNEALQAISKRFAHTYPNIEIRYLDANFPFVDGFPLLPHLSHKDGKKLDITLVYKDAEGVTNRKPSVSGYGVYADPTASEFDQTRYCKEKGYWQYDFPKYLSLGAINDDLSLSEEATATLIKLIVAQPEISKVFIEPHLKNRLRLTSPKIRFHGCQAVRHDDHIHLQVR